MAEYVYPKNVKFEPKSVQEDFYDGFLFKYFKLPELLSKPLIDNYGSKALQFIDLKILKIIYFIRVYYNEPMRINNWKLGLSSRIVRFPDCKEYTPGSMHSVVIDSKGKITKISGAVDFDIIDRRDEKTQKEIPFKHSPDKVRVDMINNKDLTPFMLVTRTEAGVKWIHVDIKPLTGDQKRIYEFKV